MEWEMSGKLSKYPNGYHVEYHLWCVYSQRTVLIVTQYLLSWMSLIVFSVYWQKKIVCVSWCLSAVIWNYSSCMHVFLLLEAYEFKHFTHWARANGNIFISYSYGIFFRVWKACWAMIFDDFCLRCHIVSSMWIEWKNKIVFFACFRRCCCAAFLIFFTVF